MELTENQIKALKLLKLLGGQVSSSHVNLLDIFSGIDQLIDDGYIFFCPHSNFVLTKQGRNELNRQKSISEMKVKLLQVAICEPICVNDVEGDFFSGDWVQMAIDEKLLSRTGVTDMSNFCDTYEYRTTRKFWKEIEEQVYPVKYDQLSYFFAVRTAKVEIVKFEDT